jgi:hypothetical protein
VPFEVLDCAFVFLRLLPRLECPQVPVPAGSGIHFSRVEAILS